MLTAILLGLAAQEIEPRPMAPPEQAYSAFSEDKARQFDFWIGTWDVAVKANRDGQWGPLTDAKASIYPVLGGKAIVELWDSPQIKGFSLRYFDAAEDKWQLFLDWPGPNFSRPYGLLGEFTHGRGTFELTRPNQDGTETLVRYNFTDITPFSLRWDDNFSNDGGKSWTHNWIMQFTRTGMAPAWPTANAPTLWDGDRCTAESFRAYEVLEGQWQGEAGQFDAIRIIGGCGMLARFGDESKNYLWLLTWNSVAEKYEIAVLDDVRGTAIVRYFGDNAGTVEADEGSWSWSVDGDRLTIGRKQAGEQSELTFTRG